MLCYIQKGEANSIHIIYGIRVYILMRNNIYIVGIQIFVIYICPIYIYIYMHASMERFCIACRPLMCNRGEQ